MRQIFPVPVGGRAGGAIGPVDPLGAAGRIAPSAPGAWEDLVAALAEVYACPATRWVRANMIASVDGAIAVNGRSSGLSGAADRLVFTVLRSLADVVLVGAGTTRAERYRRAQPDELWQQLRVGRPQAPPIAVVTRRLDLDIGGSLFGPAADGDAAGLAKTIVLTTQLAPADRLAAAERVADVVVAGATTVTAQAAVDALAARGHRAILAEGGPMLLGQLAGAGLLDELCLTISPVLEGGYAQGRATASDDHAPMTGLRLATALEDDGFLLTRYVRA